MRQLRGDTVEKIYIIIEHRYYIRRVYTHINSLIDILRSP